MKSTNCSKEERMTGYGCSRKDMRIFLNHAPREEPSRDAGCQASRRNGCFQRSAVEPRPGDAEHNQPGNDRDRDCPDADPDIADHLPIGFVLRDLAIALLVLVGRAHRQSPLSSLLPSLIAFSSEVGTGSREENASKQESRASVLMQSEPIML